MKERVRIPALLRMLRPKHWIKNVLVLFPMIFGGACLSSGPVVLKGLAAFAAFCLLASAVYVLNDIFDVESDRKHPTKCKRPLAAGEVTKGQATVFLVVLVAGAAALAFVAGGGLAAYAVLLAYAVLNVLYSLRLKQIAVIDIAILASGFFLRVLYGSYVTDISISTWLYLTVLTLSFYLGLAKRRQELVRGTASTTRSVLKSYSREFLDSNMMVFLAIGLVFYSLWAAESARVMANPEALLWSIPVVFLICIRYNYLLTQGSYEDPVETVLGDPVLLVLLVAFAACTVVSIYVMN